MHQDSNGYESMLGFEEATSPSHLEQEGTSAFGWHDDHLDDGLLIDDSYSESTGSEEGFPEPDPSNPADGGLRCLGSRPWSRAESSF